jgi:SulP family sulfate permease
MTQATRHPVAARLMARARAYDWRTYRKLFTPKLVTALSSGYDADALRHDALAGLTVAILALPLSMAIAIGAGTTPDKGLVTAVVAGFVISALGGSRFQIGGPAAAFIVIVADVSARHGYGGLMTATLLAGVVLVVAGLLRLGTYIKYIPGPVILGFTSGIGVLIGVGQIKDFLGLRGELPADVLPKLAALWSARDTFAPAAFAVGLATLAGIIGLKRLRPKWPGLLISVVAASGGAWLLGLPIDTVGTRYGGLPGTFPAPVLPDLSWAAVQPVLPASFTIAFLIGVESLLSAVAADAMAGTRHRSNMEIVAQGAANIASPLFGGLPATGVIARTGTSIAAGARTPVAGVLHALFVLVFILLLAPVASYLALPCLAAVLLTTAWRLLELEHMRHFLSRAPWDDRVILAATTLLTVFVDLSVAIAVGVVLASMLFMHRMAETPGVHLGTGPLVLEDQVDGSQPRSLLMTQDLPPGVRVFDFRGPLFFGASARIGTVLKALGDWPKVLILRMREVPLIDATAIEALQEIAALSSRHGCRIVIAGLQAQPREALHRYGFLRENRITLAPTGAIALEKARALLGRSGGRESQRQP